VLDVLKVLDVEDVLLVLEVDEVDEVLDVLEVLDVEDDLLVLEVDGVDEVPHNTRSCTSSAATTSACSPDSSCTCTATAAPLEPLHGRCPCRRSAEAVTHSLLVLKWFAQPYV
jgi:hypothetical protein